MIKPEIHSREKERQKNLDSYSILDTMEEEDYDNITAIAAEICGTPIALISLIDDKRQWFKSHHGLDATETPKELAFCAHAINTPDRPFMIQDARIDERFHDNPLVTGDPHVIFYAGIPLVSDEGFPLGTLCVIDHQPNQLTQKQLESMKALSTQVINLLRLRKNQSLLEQTILSLEEKNQVLEQFAIIAAHDLKSPLIGISGMATCFSQMYASKIDQDGREMLDLIVSSSDKLRRLIDGLLAYSRSERVLKDEKTQLCPQVLVDELSRLFVCEKQPSIRLRSTLEEININKTALDQILINLITNAIKYNDKEAVEIVIGISANDNWYEFFVQDNGPGIAPKYHEKIFRIFEVVATEDKTGIAGNGIGLATVKRLVEKMGGAIRLESEEGKGSKFIFTLEK